VTARIRKERTVKKAMILWLAAAVGAVAALAAQTQAASELQPGADERVLVVLQAAGVQVYQCLGSEATRHEWAFVGPEADLYDGSGRRVGRHYGGPTWEALDGGRVTGTVAARAQAHSPDSIPWLRLAAQPARRAGLFAGVTTIQRIDTVGGAAPKDGCGPQAVGEQVRVPYSAQYVFYTR
jgi:hypothetical protein